jgi:hypothetical protein
VKVLLIGNVRWDMYEADGPDDMYLSAGSQRPLYHQLKPRVRKKPMTCVSKFGTDIMPW